MNGFFARLSRAFSARAAAILGLSLVAIWSQMAVAQSTTISDHDFIVGTWTHHDYSSDLTHIVLPSGQHIGASSCAVAAPITTNNPWNSTSGNPYYDVSQTYGSTGHDTNPWTANVSLCVHIYGGPNSTYAPTVSGNIATVSFSIGYICGIVSSTVPYSYPSGAPFESGDGNQCYNTVGEAFAFTLRQGGTDYIAVNQIPWYYTNDYSNPLNAYPQTRWPPTTPPANWIWRNQPSPGYMQYQFCKVTTHPGPSGISVVTGQPFNYPAVEDTDCTSHPDFSQTTGGLIQCGFATMDAIYQPNDYYGTRESGYDDFSCTFQAAAPPTGKLTVTKVLQGPPLPNYHPTFIVKVVCGTGLPYLHITVPNSPGSASTQIPNLTPGTVCTFSEVPPLPALPSGCAWLPPPQSPIYAPPSQSVTITAGNNTATITNRYDCSPATGTLTITKTVTGPPGYPIAGVVPPGTTFPIHWSCLHQQGGPAIDNSSSPFSPTINSSGLISPNSQTTPSLPLPSVCQISENPLPPPFLFHVPGDGTQFCTWQNPNIPWFVQVNSATQSLTINNRYVCVPYNPATVRVTKHISNGTWPTSAQFTFHASCTYNGSPAYSGSSPTITSIGPSWSVTSLQDGTQCTFSEQGLPGPFTNSQGQTCTWNNPVVTPQQPVTLHHQQTTVVTIFNSYTCSGNNNCPPNCPSRVNPPPPPSACPEGREPDHEGVCKLKCDAPMVPNKKQTRCVCPKGTELKEGKCVEKRSAIDDILGHVTVGVGAGVGTGESGGGRDRRQRDQREKPPRDRASPDRDQDTAEPKPQDRGPDR